MATRVPDIATATQVSADTVLGVVAASGAVKRFAASPSHAQLAAATGAGLVGYDEAETYAAGTVGAAVDAALLAADLTGASAVTPTSSDHVVGVQGGAVKRFVAGVTPVFSAAADPTTSDIAASTCKVWKNTDTGAVKLWTNDGGVMKSVALT